MDCRLQRDVIGQPSVDQLRDPVHLAGPHPDPRRRRRQRPTRVHGQVLLHRAPIHPDLGGDLPIRGSRIPQRTVTA